MVFSLQAEDAGGGWARLSTETRVLVVDEQGQRAVAAYWRMIYPGSGMLRLMWLYAARAQLEAGHRGVRQARAGGVRVYINRELQA